MTMLVLFWLFVENASTQKIGNHAYYTFWYVLGSLPFFVIFPYLLPKLGFGLAMGVSVLATLVFFGMYAWGLGKVGIVLI